MDEETHEHALTDIKFTFIELQKFDKQVEALETLVDKWIFFIKNAENLTVIPEHVEDEGLMEAYRDAEKHTWNKEELKRYDNAFIAEQDARGKITAARKEGIIKGRKEGLIEGEKNKTVKIVKRCLQKGMPIEEIADITALTTEEIEAIIQAFDA